LTTTSEKPIQLAGKHASICLRLRDASGQWKSGLLATADPEDQFANLVYGDGRDRLFFFAQNGAVKFENVEVRPLKHKDHPFGY